MVSIKWTYHKECSFTSNYSVFFWNVCFSLRTCYEEIVWCTNHPNLHIYAFRRSCSFIWGCRSSRPEVFCEKVFLEISQDSQENTYARVSFLIKLQTTPATLLKKRLWHRCFPVNFAKFLRTPSFTEYFWWLLLRVLFPCEYR